MSSVDSALVTRLGGIPLSSAEELFSVKEGSKRRERARTNSAQTGSGNRSRPAKLAEDPHGEGVSEQIHPALRAAADFRLADHLASAPRRAHSPRAGAESGPVPTSVP